VAEAMIPIQDDAWPHTEILSFKGEPIIWDNAVTFPCIYLIPDPRDKGEGLVRVMAFLFGVKTVEAAWKYYERRDFLRQLMAMEAR
jgi:hypothetical protein